MFRVRSADSDRTLRFAIIAVLTLSVAALSVTVWVMIDFLAEQEIVKELIRELPPGARSKAEALAGELRWQFRLSMLIVLNLVVTAFALVLLTRAYRSSQRSLRDIKALAADILSSMDQAVMTTDVAGNVTSINQRGMMMLSAGVDCVGHPLEHLSNVIPLERLRSDWHVECPESLVRDSFVTCDGTERVWRAYCQALNDYEGHRIGNVLQIRDVTQTTLIEDRMRRMERYMGLGSLAAGLHHEIKNPLAALSLHVQLLEEQIEADDVSQEVQQMLGVIGAEVTRIGGVLESFRDFASVDELNLCHVDLVELVRRQVELATPRIRNSQIHVRQEISSGIPEVMADSVRIEQVLLNLILNATDAMPEGGELTITMRARNDAVIIAVSDTGRGIPTDLRDRILDPYFTTKSAGTGLGLALCDKILRQHNGTLDFSSSSSGTTFELTLPVDALHVADRPELRTARSDG